MLGSSFSSFKSSVIEDGSHLVITDLSTDQLKKLTLFLSSHTSIIKVSLVGSDLNNSILPSIFRILENNWAILEMNIRTGFFITSEESEFSEPEIISSLEISELILRNKSFAKRIAKFARDNLVKDEQKDEYFLSNNANGRLTSSDYEKLSKGGYAATASLLPSILISNVDAAKMIECLATLKAVAEQHSFVGKLTITNNPLERVREQSSF